MGDEQADLATSRAADRRKGLVSDDQLLGLSASSDRCVAEDFVVLFAGFAAGLNQRLAMQRVRSIGIRAGGDRSDEFDQSFEFALQFVFAEYGAHAQFIVTAAGLAQRFPQLIEVEVGGILEPGKKGGDGIGHKKAETLKC